MKIYYTLVWYYFLYLLCTHNIFKMETKNKEKVESVDLLLKSVWFTVSKMYSEQASLHNSTACTSINIYSKLIRKKN